MKRLIVLLAASLVAMSASAVAASFAPGSHALPPARVQLAPELPASDVNTIAGGLDAFVTWTDKLFLNATSSSGAELLEQRLPLIGAGLDSAVSLPQMLSPLAALKSNVYTDPGAEAALIQDLGAISGVSSVATTSDGTIHLVFSTSSDPVVVDIDDDFGIEGQGLSLSPGVDSKISLSVVLSLDLTFGATTSEFFIDSDSDSFQLSLLATTTTPFDAVGRLGFVDVSTAGIIVGSTGAGYVVDLLGDGDTLREGDFAKDSPDELVELVSVDASGALNVSLPPFDVNGLATTPQTANLVITYDLATSEPSADIGVLGDLVNFQNADSNSLLSGLIWISEWLAQAEDFDALGAPLPLVGENVTELASLAGELAEEVSDLIGILTATTTVSGVEELLHPDPSAVEMVQLLSDAGLTVATSTLTTAALTYTVSFSEADVFEGATSTPVALDLVRGLEGLSLTLDEEVPLDLSAGASFSMTVGIKLGAEEELAPLLGLNVDDFDDDGENDDADADADGDGLDDATFDIDDDADGRLDSLALDLSVGSSTPEGKLDALKAGGLMIDFDADSSTYSWTFAATSDDAANELGTLCGQIDLLEVQGLDVDAGKMLRILGRSLLVEDDPQSELPEDPCDPGSGTPVQISVDDLLVVAEDTAYELPSVVNLGYRFYVETGADVFTLTAEIAGSDIDVGAHLGFLDLRTSVPDVQVQGAFSIELIDPGTSLSDGKLDLMELFQALASSTLASAMVVSVDGSVDAQFGLENDAIAATRTLGVAGDLAQALDDLSNVITHDLDELLNFDDITAAQMIALIVEASGWLAEHENEGELGNELPLIGARASDVSDFAGGFAEMADRIAHSDPTDLTAYDDALRVALDAMGLDSDTLSFDVTNEDVRIGFGYSQTEQMGFPLNVDLGDLSLVGGDGTEVLVDITFDFNPVLGVNFSDGRAFVAQSTSTLASLELSIGTELMSEVDIAAFNAQVEGNVSADGLLTLKLNETREFLDDPKGIDVDISGTISADIEATLFVLAHLPPARVKVLGNLTAIDNGSGNVFDYSAAIGDIDLSAKTVAGEAIETKDKVFLAHNLPSLGDFEMDLRAMVTGAIRMAQWTGRLMQESESLSLDLPALGPDFLDDVSSLGTDIEDIANEFERIWNDTFGEEGESKEQKFLDRIGGDLEAFLNGDTPPDDPLYIDVEVAGGIDAEEITIKFSMGKTATSTNMFEAGIGVDPVFSLDFDAEVDWIVGYEIALGFGINTTDGFFIIGTDSGNFLEVFLGAEGTIGGCAELQNILAIDLGGCEGGGATRGRFSIAGHEADVASFGVGFVPDFFGDDGSARLRLATFGKSSAPVDDLLKVGFDVVVDLDVPFETIVAGDTTGALPTIAGIGRLDWDLEGFAFQKPDLMISNITFDSGKVVKDLVIPTLQEIVKYNPVNRQEIKDIWFTKIPLLNAGIRDLAKVYADIEHIKLNDAPLQSWLLFEFLLNLEDQVNALANQANQGLTFNVGTYRFAGFEGVGDPPLGFDPGDFDGDGTQDGVPGFDAQYAASELKKTLDDLAAAVPKPSASEGSAPVFEFPIVSDVEQVINLLTGKEADFVRFVPPEFGVGPRFNFSRTLFDVDIGFLKGYLGVRFNANLGLTTRFGAGFDSRGLINDDLDWFDGFYVMDFLHAPGADINEVGIGGNISASIDGRFSVLGDVASVRFRGSGNISAEGGLDFKDEAVTLEPEEPSQTAGGKWFTKFHIDEIETVLETHTLFGQYNNPLCIFDVAAFLRGYISFKGKAKVLGITVFNESWDSRDHFPETIWEWRVGCPPKVVLAKVTNGEVINGQVSFGELVLGAGPNAGIRDARGDIAETLAVTPVGGTTYEVSGMHFEQTYSGVSTGVTGLMGDKDDTLTLHVSISIPVLADGGDGEDTIGFSGTSADSAPAFDASGSDVRALATSSLSGGEGGLFAGTGGGLFKSTDGGDTWLRNGFPGLDVDIVEAARDAGGTVFASAAAGLFRSTDGGDTWLPIDAGLGGGDLQALALSPAYGSDATVFAGTSGGLFRSTNGGDSWEAIDTGSTSTVKALAFSPAFEDDTTLFAGTSAGLSRSTGGGDSDSWDQLATDLDGADVGAIAASRAFEDDRTLFVGTANGLFRSTDGGVSFAEIGAGSISGGIRTLGLSPTFDEDGVAFAGTSSGLFHSTDGGSAWTRVNLSIDDVRDILVTASFTADARVFAGTSGGVFRSDVDEDKENVELASDGLASNIINLPGGGLVTHAGFERIDGVPPTIVSSASTVEEGSVFAPLFSFIDFGAQNWSATVDFGDGSSIRRVTIDAEDDPVGGPIFPMSIPVTHVYAEDSAALVGGVYVGEVCVEDLTDHNASCEQFEVTVTNAAPKDVDPGFDRSVDEGASISLSSSRYTDPGTLDTHTAVVDWGDGDQSDAAVTEHPFGPPGREAGLVGGISQTHVYLDDGAYPVTVCVTDDELAKACGGGTTVTVNNVAPDIRLVDTDNLHGASPPGVTSGETFTLFFSITDPGPLDTHMITVDWGDGSTSAQPTSDRSFAPMSHKYESRTSTKNFDLTVTVADDDGGSGSLTMTIRALAAPGGAPSPTVIIVPFQPPRGDLNGDWLLTEADIVLFQGAFGSVVGDSAYLSTADLNDDGFIDLRDLGILASLFGARGY